MIQLRNSLHYLIQDRLPIACTAIFLVGRLAKAAPLNDAPAETLVQMPYLAEPLNFIPVVKVRQNSGKLVEFAVCSNTTEPIKYFAGLPLHLRLTERSC